MDIRWHINTALIKIAINFLKWSGWYDGYWDNWRGEMFSYAQKQGLHILPVHYYSPVPKTDELSQCIWEKKSELIGIELNIDLAVDLLMRLAKDYQQEYTKFPYEPTSNHQQFYLNNSAYGSGDAEILYSMIRDRKPQRIIEIGSGNTTLLISQAIRKNRSDDSDYSCDFLAIEPYPPEYLNPLPTEVGKILQQQVQTVPIEEFTSLKSGDILFIDSSHVAKIGSDVIYEYLEILPRLDPGVLIHIDDIFLPMNYPYEWIDKFKFFWNEQYLLQGFLSFNQQFKVIMPTYALDKQYPEILKTYIPSCAGQNYLVSSFWIEKCIPS